MDSALCLSTSLQRYKFPVVCARGAAKIPHPPDPPPPQAGEGGMMARAGPVPPTTTALLAQSRRS